MKLFAILLLTLPVAARAQFTYTTSGSSAAITGYTGAGGAVVVPGTISVYTVTSIGASAFYGRTSLTSVTILNNVTNIGADAFAYCTNLAGVTMPNSLAGIGQAAFFGCVSLTSVIIPGSVAGIGDGAFALCSGLQGAYFAGNAPPDDGTVFSGDIATAYYLPGTTGWKADFGGIPAVEETSPTQFTYVTNNNAIVITGCTGSVGAVIIPNPINGYAVAAIAGLAFDSTTVTSATIPSSVTTIGEAAFAYCSSLTNVILPNSVTAIGQGIFFGCVSLTSVAIPNSFTSTGFETFGNCSSLTNVTIPKSVTSIGDQSFQGCASLTSVAIPIGVTSIGMQAYQGCTSLTSAYFQGNAPPDSGHVFDGDPATVYYLAGTTGWGATFGGAPAVEETAPAQFTYVTNNDAIAITGYTGSGGAIIIPNTINGYSVTGIGGNAFYLRSGLTSVIIPSSVATIGQTAFQDCTGLTNVNIPSAVTSIADGAFFDCGSLPGVTIPSGVTAIGPEAFAYCFNLTNVNIPNHVASIGHDAFFDCISLTGVVIPRSVMSIGDDAFTNCLSLAYAYFLGNAPPDDGTVFMGDLSVVYYLPGTTGWGASFGGVPAILLAGPKVLSNDATFGVQNNRFGFTISWPINSAVIVQAATNLANPVWVPIATNSMAGGAFYFSDANWRNYPGRFYRLNAR